MPPKAVRRDASVIAYLTPEEFRALKDRATSEDRTISTTVARILRRELSETSEAAGQGGSAKTRMAVRNAGD